MLQKIIQFGNDLALPLPEKFVSAFQLAEGDEVLVTLDPEHNRILISPVGELPDLSGIDQAFSEQLARFLRDYKPALDQLSKSDS